MGRRTLQQLLSLQHRILRFVYSLLRPPQPLPCALSWPPANPVDQGDQTPMRTRSSGGLGVTTVGSLPSNPTPALGLTLTYTLTPNPAVNLATRTPALTVAQA